ncbi:MAG: MinD/ParA family protein [Phycisphaerales bacterium]
MHQSGDSRTDVFDELAQLFIDDERSIPITDLREGSEPAPLRLAATDSNDSIDPRRAVDPAPIDLLFAANLPVATGPWIAQTAATLAERGGATGLIRIVEYSARVDAFPIGVDRTDFETLSRSSDPKSLDEAHAILSSWIDQWIVAAPAPDAWLAKIDAARRVRRIIILTGTDQAAVISAYRLIKQIVGFVDGRVRFGLAIVGANDDAARAVYERLAASMSDFLGRPLDLLAVTPRIESHTSRNFGEFELGVDPVVRSVEALALEDPPPARVHACDAGDSSAPTSSNDDAIEEVEAPEVVIASPPLEPWPARLQPTLRERGHASGAAARDASPPEVSSKSDEVKSPAVDKAAPSLSRFVRGLAPLKARRPGYDEIEIAVDGRGGLHVIARDSDYAGDRMRSVADWAAEHRALLALTDGRVNTSSDAAEPTVHLLTRDPEARHSFAGPRRRVHLVLSPAECAEAVRSADGWLSMAIA